MRINNSIKFNESNNQLLRNISVTWFKKYV